MEDLHSKTTNSVDGNTNIRRKNANLSPIALIKIVVASFLFFIVKKYIGTILKDTNMKEQGSIPTQRPNFPPAFASSSFPIWKP